MCLCIAATLLDNAILSVSACTALAEIGHRNPLPLHDSSLPHDDQSGPLTTGPVTTDRSGQPTTASVVENLISKVKSTSENAKV